MDGLAGPYSVSLMCDLIHTETAVVLAVEPSGIWMQGFIREGNGTGTGVQ
ncbi:hypothetical protein [Paenibacillus sp. LjRoot56]